MEALAVLAQLRLFVAVDRVPQNGVADVGHVDPNLVGPARFQVAADVGIAPVALDHLPVGYGGLGIALGDAHLLPIRRVPPNGGIHGAAVLFQIAADNGLVGPRHGVVFQLRGQDRVGQVIFGNGQKSGGVLINPVDNAWAQLPIDAGKAVSHGIEKTVHQGVVLVPRRRVDHQTLGLVDDRQILVLVDNVQLHLSGYHVDGLGIRNRQGDFVPGLQAVIFFGRSAVQTHISVGNQLLGGASAQVRNGSAEKGIQPLSRLVRCQNHFFSSFQISLLQKARLANRAIQPQVMKQSATLNTGKSINWVSIISTT